MELPEIGLQCSMEICNQLDFLPIKCSYCQKVFCKDHSSLISHNCQCLNEPQVPKVIKEVQDFRPKCSFGNCEKKAVTTCPVCDNQFCMDHRLEVDHKCSKVYENLIEDSMPKTKALVASILASKPKRDPKVVKDQKMAAKVQLMKLKMKAQGSKAIMSSERIYFGIKSTTKEDLTPVFVCSKWPFGRVLDFVIDTMGIKRNQKLSLIKSIDGQVVTNELDKILEEMIKDEEIFNGDILILDYVDEISNEPKIECPMECPMESSPEIPMSSLKTLSKPDPKIVKKQKMAAKVQLMKLKMKAQGSKSIPMDERIYFGIKSATNKDMKPVFVSIKWSLGKVLDSVASLIGLENKNNVSGAAKLKLFKSIDGQVPANELDVGLESLLKSEELFNGDTLIIDYVQDPSIKQIDPKNYN